MSDSSPAPDGAPVHDAPTLAEKVARAMSEAGQVLKSEQADQGSGGRYRYASAEAILGAVRHPLLTAGVLVYPTVTDWHDAEVKSSGGKVGTLATVTVTFTFTDGRETLAVEGWKGQGQDYGDKAYGKAYTNAVKTFVRVAWLLPTEHDDPEKSASGERVSGAAPALPKWAQETDRPAEFGEALAPLIGADRARASYAAVKASLGEVPDLVVMVAKLLAANVADVHAKAGLEEDVAGLLKREAGTLDPDGPVAPEPDPSPPEDTAPTEHVRVDSPGGFEAHADAQPEPEPGDSDVDPDADLARFTAEPPAPGSRAVKGDDLPKSVTARTRKLKELGCTCGAPIVAQKVVDTGQLPDDARDVDSACPLHGIPL